MVKHYVKLLKLGGQRLVFCLAIATGLMVSLGILLKDADAQQCGSYLGYGKTKMYGGPGGGAFSDDLTQVVRITRISIRSGEYVDAIQTTWLSTSQVEQTGDRHGGTGGSEQVINLEPNEYITRIDGRSGKYIDQLKFTTNLGNTFGPYGKGGGAPFALSKLSVGGFFGQSGDYLDALGVFSQTPCR